MHICDPMIIRTIHLLGTGRSRLFHTDISLSLFFFLVFFLHIYYNVFCYRLVVTGSRVVDDYVDNSDDKIRSTELLNQSRSLICCNLSLDYQMRIVNIFLSFVLLT